jgi:hypothetical protein
MATGSRSRRTSIYQNDPGETRNIASDEAAVVTGLRQLLAARGEAKPQVR